MTATLLPRAAGAKAGTTPTQAKESRRWRDPIAAELAFELGLSPLTMEHRLVEARLVMAKALAAMLARGAAKRAETYAEPVLRVLEGRDPPPDCDATWSLADSADAKEDVIESRYHRDPSIKNRQAYIDALREERRHTTALIDMLLDEQERAQRARS